MNLVRPEIWSSHKRGTFVRSPLVGRLLLLLPSHVLELGPVDCSRVDEKLCPRATEIAWLIVGRPKIEVHSAPLGLQAGLAMGQSR